MSKNFDFRQFEKYLKKFDKLPTDFELFLYNFIVEMGLRALNKIKPRTPVDTGALKAAFNIEDVVVNKDEVSVTISNPMEYASYVEYGAPNRNGTWRNGRFMMTIGVDEIRKQLPARFNKEFNNWMKNKGIG